MLKEKNARAKTEFRLKVSGSTISDILRLRLEKIFFFPFYIFFGVLMLLIMVKMLLLPLVELKESRGKQIQSIWWNHCLINCRWILEWLLWVWLSRASFSTFHFSFLLFPPSTFHTEPKSLPNNTQHKATIGENHIYTKSDMFRETSSEF